MAHEITLTDSSSTWTSPTPNTPLTVQTIEAASEVTTLDLNLYVDLFDTKKVWTVRWGSMDAANYQSLRGFYDRQHSTLEFPYLTIPDLNVSGVVTRMTMSDQSITDESGLVENVEIVLRETIQVTEGY